MARVVVPVPPTLFTAIQQMDFAHDWNIGLDVALIARKYHITIKRVSYWAKRLGLRKRRKYRVREDLVRSLFV
jgi:Mor family transcriptional regulator